MPIKNEQNELEKIIKGEELISCNYKKCEMRGDYWKCYMRNHKTCPIYLGSKTEDTTNSKTKLIYKGKEYNIDYEIETIRDDGEFKRYKLKYKDRILTSTIEGEVEEYFKCLIDNQLIK